MLKEIRIHNYKIFGGNYRMLLSTESDRPFTVVSTITASGKTTMVDAILWCLGKTLRWNSRQQLLNIEVEQSLALGETADVIVDLLFDVQGKEFRLRRSACIRKNADNLSVIKEDFCINDISLAAEVYKAIIDEIFPLWRFMITMFDERILMLDFPRKLQEEIYQYVKSDIRFGDVLKDIEIKANNLLSSLHYGNGRFRISWNHSVGFEILIMQGSKWENYSPSTTMVIATNVAITIAAYRILSENSTVQSTMPFILDDFLGRADKKQFSVNEICELLHPQQTLLLLHQNSLDGVSANTVNKFGKRYTMLRTRDWTNVELTASGEFSHV